MKVVAFLILDELFLCESMVIEGHRHVPIYGLELHGLVNEAEMK